MTTPPLFITTPTNIQYLTGFLGALPDEREAFVLLTDKTIYLFTNVLYMEEAKELSNSQIIKLSNKQIQVVEISRENPLSKELAKIMEELQKDWIPGQARNDTVLEFEEDNLTVAEFKKLKKELKGITLKPTQGQIAERRMIKRSDEIEDIRKACTITDQCFQYITANLTPGVEERAIALDIEMYFRTRGAELAFSPIVAFGVNSSKPHYSGQGNSRLRSNDIVLLDFGAKVNGYCADMTRVVFVGSPPEAWRKAYEVALASQQQALTHLASGTKSGSTLDAAAKKVITDAGLPPYPHSLGHGLGLDIHEAPRLSIKRDAELKTGMAVTVEPGIYVEGQFGIRIEDTVLITENSVEVLTRARKDIIIL